MCDLYRTQGTKGLNLKIWSLGMILALHELIMCNVNKNYSRYSTSCFEMFKLIKLNDTKISMIFTIHHDSYHLLPFILKKIATLLQIFDTFMCKVIIFLGFKYSHPAITCSKLII